MTQSSFYSDTPNYATDYPTQNDSNTNPVTGNPAAPSSFYPNGDQYAALADSDAVVAELQALEAQTETNASNAATSASNAATSATNAATSAANAAGAVQSAAGTVTPVIDGTAAVGTSTKWAHEDHVHPTDTSRADAAATTAALALKADKTYVDTQDALKAPLASPALTGTPTAPTPTAGDNSTKVATTAFVGAAITNIGVTAVGKAAVGHIPAQTGSGSAAAGELGEHVSTLLSGSITASNVAVSCGSITLSAGDWDVSSVIVYNAKTGATTGTDWIDILSTISTPSIAVANAIDSTQYRDRLASVADHSSIHTHAPYRLSLASSTTIYAHATSTFSAGTGYDVSGFLKARRAS